MFRLLKCTAARLRMFRIHGCVCFTVDVLTEDSLEMLFTNEDLAKLAFKPRPRGNYKSVSRMLYTYRCSA
jgi:hypothetical protein